MIILTGAAGFIGSCIAGALNEQGEKDLILVDDFSKSEKAANWQNKQYLEAVHREDLFDWWSHKAGQIRWVLHLGARTDTAEQDEQLFDRLNISYSQKIWTFCAKHEIPLIYASSAATYGNGELGFSDQHQGTAQFQPLNPYGWSKQKFDLWALKQEKHPPFWVGLKFFNVYGPNEYHKGRMASVVMHTFHQITQTGKMRLFRSHKAGIADGQQKRDFVYVMDLISVIQFLMDQKPDSGLYNLGTGQARSFLDLAHQVFESMNRAPQIEFIDTPVDIRSTYQYFTEADISRLRNAGYQKSFSTLEMGVDAYIRQYLSLGKVY